MKDQMKDQETELLRSIPGHAVNTLFKTLESLLRTDEWQEIHRAIEEAASNGELRIKVPNVSEKCCFILEMLGYSRVSNDQHTIISWL